MEHLDSDDGLLRSNGRVAERDIVQVHYALVQSNVLFSAILYELAVTILDSLYPPKVHFNLKVTVRSFQFVPLRNFLGDRFQNNSQASQAHLAKEVLAEIPSQVTLYMKKRGIKPRAPPPAYQTTDAPNSQPASAPMW